VNPGGNGQPDPEEDPEAGSNVPVNRRRALAAAGGFAFTGNAGSGSNLDMEGNA
jgi:hypothetical protein